MSSMFLYLQRKEERQKIMAKKGKNKGTTAKVKTATKRATPKAKSIDETMDGMEHEIDRLNAEADAKDEKIAELIDEIDQLKNSVRLSGEGEPSQSLGECDLTVYDVAACIGAIKDQMNGYPLSDDEFNRVALGQGDSSGSVKQAVRLALYIRDAINEEMADREAMGKQQEAAAEEEAAKKKVGPLLP
jgi:hypothetical protein